MEVEAKESSFVTKWWFIALVVNAIIGVTLLEISY